MPGPLEARQIERKERTWVVMKKKEQMKNVLGKKKINNYSAGNKQTKYGMS